MLWKVLMIKYQINLSNCISRNRAKVSVDKNIDKDIMLLDNINPHTDNRDASKRKW